MSRERLERCFHLCAQRAWRLACVMLGDSHAASDCVQQAFTAAARKPARVPADDPWPWFSTVLFHEIRNHRRKRRPGPMPEEFDMQGQTPDPAAQAQRHETEGGLRLALDTLPEPERDAITLTYIGGLTHVQAAQVLEMPAKTLSSHVMRGLERLRKRLNHKQETLLSGLAALPLLTPPGGWESTLAAWQGAAAGSAVLGTVAVVGGTIMAKKAMLAAGLVLALLVGFGGGMLVDRDTEDVTPPASLQAGNPRARPAATTSDPTPLDESATPSRRPDTWLAAFADEKPQAGAGRIFGRTALRDGTPLPGVVVTALAQYPAELPRDAAVDQSVEDFARRAYFAAAGKFTAVSDADGRYEIARLGDYEFAMSAVLRGHEFEVLVQGRRGVKARPGDEVDFAARVMYEFELAVLLPDGSTPASASGELVYHGGGHYYVGWTPGRAPFAMPFGRGTLTLRAGEFYEFAAPPMELEFKPGDPPRTIKVQMKAWLGILCRVKVPEGWLNPDKVSLFLVRNHPEGPPQLPPSSESLRAIGLRREVRYSGLEPGRFRLIAFVDFIPVAWQDVTVGEESLTITLEVPDQDVSKYFVTRLFDPDGNPPKGVRLMAHIIFEGKHESSSNNAIARKDGTYWVERPTAEGTVFSLADRHSYELEAQSPDFGMVRVKCPPEPGREIEVRFQKPGVLTVSFPGALAQKIGLRAALSQQRGETSAWLPVDAGGEGYSKKVAAETLTWRSLAPGRYRLSLVRNDGRQEDDTPRIKGFGSWEFEVTSGENKQTCPMPRLGKLTLVIADPKVAQYASLKREGSDSWLVVDRSQIAERIVLEDVPVGDWIAATAQGQMKFTVSGDTELTLVVRPYDCMALARVKAGGKLERMGFQSGDKLIAVDGQHWEAITMLIMQYQASMRRESTTWTLLRGGTTVQVTFDGRELYAMIADESAWREGFNPQQSFREP